MIYYSSICFCSIEIVTIVYTVYTIVHGSVYIRGPPFTTVVVLL